MTLKERQKGSFCAIFMVYAKSRYFLCDFQLSYLRARSLTDAILCGRMIINTLSANISLLFV